MKALSICLTAVLVLSGCATPGKVQQMIEENNQKLASEQLKPEFDRINSLLTETSARMKSLDKQITDLQTAMTDEQQLSSAKIQNLSLALNKAQGDMGLVQEKINEIQGVFSMQQKDIKETRKIVDAQKDALLTVFRKQQEELTKVISTLEAFQKPAANGDATGLTAPAPIE
jgi:chromosome segregation ATPase